MSRPEALALLYEVLRQRVRERPAESYVSELLDGGMAAIGAKVCEEAQELVAAAEGDDPTHTVHEAADLLFHVWVLLANAGIEPAEVYRELERRSGTSGLAEKASREKESC